MSVIEDMARAAGFVIVPKEPTPRMIGEAAKAIAELPVRGATPQLELAVAYRAMLSAYHEGEE